MRNHTRLPLVYINRGSTIVFHSVLLPTSGANLSYATKQLKKETLVVSETGLASSTVKQFLSELNTSHIKLSADYI